MDCSTEAPTVRLNVPLTVPRVAVSVAVPCAAAVTRPDDEMVATEVDELDHVTELVRFWLEPSL